jgi:nucleotide-binding universal stress UspA family protein
MPSAAQAVASRIVVVGYDGSQAARRALRRAAEVAGPGGEVVVVTAAPPPNPRDWEAETEVPREEPSRLLAEAAGLLERFEVEVSTRVERAEPAEALADAARSVDAAVIVVGARGGSYLSRALRGPVAEMLVTRSPCDLLVAR